MSHLSPQIVKDYLRYGVPDKKNGETLADLKRSSVFRPGKVADGHSLFLMVRRRALGFWIGQYRNGSSFNSTGLGSAAEVSPAAARRRWERSALWRRTPWPVPLPRQTPPSHQRLPPDRSRIRRRSRSSSALSTAR